MLLSNRMFIGIVAYLVIFAPSVAANDLCRFSSFEDLHQASAQDSAVDCKHIFLVLRGRSFPSESSLNLTMFNHVTVIGNAETVVSVDNTLMMPRMMFSSISVRWWARGSTATITSSFHQSIDKLILISSEFVFVHIHSNSTNTLVYNNVFLADEHQISATTEDIDKSSFQQPDTFNTMIDDDQVDTIWCGKFLKGL